MAEIELIQERLISGKGVLKVPSDVVKNRLYILYTDVVREPKNKYINLNYNPGRSRYATICFFRTNYLIADIPIEFPRQVFDGVNDICGQNLIALKCAYSGILQTFINLGLALNLPPISVQNTIETYTNLRLAWDEMRIVCYADTAIQCRLYRLKYDVCDTDYDDDFPPPPPPAPLPSVPPGTPLDTISQPYSGSNDGGNTQPYSGDTLYVPPIADGVCTKYQINYSYNIVNAIGQPAGRRTTSVTCWGIIKNIRITGTQLQAECQGLTTNPCTTLAWFTLFTDGAVSLGNPGLTYTVQQVP